MPYINFYKFYINKFYSIYLYTVYNKIAHLNKINLIQDLVSYKESHINSLLIKDKMLIIQLKI
jgi:hypothetical protein